MRSLHQNPFVATAQNLSLTIIHIHNCSLKLCSHVVINNVLVLGVLLNRVIKIINGYNRFDRTLMHLPLFICFVKITYFPHNCFARNSSCNTQKWEILISDLLILRVTHFVLLGQIDPHLKAVQQSARMLFALVVYDATTGGHPLHVAFFQHAFVSHAILMATLAFLHVHDRVKASVWMPWRSWKLSNFVDDRTQLIKHQKRIRLFFVHV
mmetsp:Transcript_37293/g.61330  ORF Transcript_37293/g.61330 Transcript_37293/m.61330 type:complete len:210 (+) Transcript_37293:258-887(+)